MTSLKSQSAPSTEKHLAHPKYRPDIDGMRAIAVLAVVGFHAFPNWLRGGFVGVDIFFVISGFLISTIIFGSLDKNNFSFIEFYSRRVNRIFPALLLVLASCFAVGWFILLPEEFKTLGSHIAAGAGFFSNLLLITESGYFDGSAETKPLLHLWSLGIEEQFYILWPILLWAATKTKKTILPIILLALAASFALNIYGVHESPTSTFYSPLSRFWELLSGSLLAWISLYSGNRKINQLGFFGDRALPRNINSALGAALILSSIIITSKEKSFPGWWAIPPVLGAVLIISAGPHAWINRKLLSNRALVWVGLISFPLYLWHWPILSFLRIIEGESPATHLVIGAVFASFTLAYLTYRIIERPARTKPKKHQTAVLIALMMTAGVAGVLTYTMNGFGFRFPQEIQKIVQFRYDPKEPFRQYTCFLEKDQDFTQFKDCGVTRDRSKETILIWGDSHAAQLYSGYKAAFGKDFNLIQRTASLCMPIVGIEKQDRAFCKDINNDTLALIKREMPDKVVLAAYWSQHDWPRVSETITRLKEIGIKRIDLIGPVPIWRDGLPKELYNHFKNDPLHRIPKRMLDGLVFDSFQPIDAKLEEIARTGGANYISPAKILCNQDGCLTMLGDKADSIITFEVSHLTSTGSIYLVSKFPKPDSSSE